MIYIAGLHRNRHPRMMLGSLANGQRTVKLQARVQLLYCAYV